MHLASCLPAPMNGGRVLYGWPAYGGQNKTLVIKEKLKFKNRSVQGQKSVKSHYVPIQNGSFDNQIIVTFATSLRERRYCGRRRLCVSVCVSVCLSVRRAATAARVAYGDVKFHEIFLRELFHEIFREIFLKYLKNVYSSEAWLLDYGCRLCSSLQQSK